MLKKIITISIFVLLILILLHYSRIITNDISMVEYELYSDYINTSLSEIDTITFNNIVIIDSTYSRYSLSDDDIEHIEKNVNFKIPKDIIDDFKIKNAKAYKINRFFDINLKYSFISNEELKSIFVKGSWKTFYEKFPDSNGRTYISRIGFNEVETEALAYIDVRSGGLAGVGYFVFFEKINGIWKTKSIAQMWVS